MSIPGPTVEELERRISRHLAYRPGNDVVVALWMGYLMALLEFDMISVNAHARVVSLLPKVGLQEFEELLGDIPDAERVSDLK